MTARYATFWEEDMRNRYCRFYRRLILEKEQTAIVYEISE
jgi:hypothetical protein